VWKYFDAILLGADLPLRGYAFWRFSEVLAKYDEKHLLHEKHLTQ
jgi:hypothetical protein